MSFDYDLVIIGATPAGMAAAIAALALQARVALVTQDIDPVSLVLGHRPLLEAARMIRQSDQARQFGLLPPSEPVLSVPPWQSVELWQKTASAAIAEQYSLAVLAAQGIEVIVGSGSFQSQSQLAFTVVGRSLRSRRYLLALPIVAASPPATRVAPKELTPAQLLSHLTQSAPPPHLVLSGHSSSTLEVAQALRTFGLAITLAVPTATILPGHDQEMAIWLQASLEADGIKVLTCAPITQVKQIQGAPWVQVGTVALPADEVIQLTPPAYPASLLNLNVANVALQAGQIVVNPYLQTTHSQIYACPFGGNFGVSQQAAAIAELAAYNALSIPLRQRPVWQLGTIHSVATDPICAWFGVTEAEAAKRYGKDYQVIRHSLQANDHALLRGELGGWCKVIVRGDGQIAGAAIVGAEAHEWIGAIALAKQQRIPLQQLSRLNLPPSSFSKTLQQIGRDWKHQQAQQHPLTRLRASWGG